MTILADSNIFIEFWKRPDQRMMDLFSDGNLDIVICGPIRSELLHGAYSDKNFVNIDSSLNDFAEYNVEDSEWSEVGKLLYTLRTNGITVPYVDALIAYIASKNRFQVWTHDKHFKLIKLAIPELEIFDEDSWLIK